MCIFIHVHISFSKKRYVLCALYLCLTFDLLVVIDKEKDSFPGGSMNVCVKSYHILMFCSIRCLFFYQHFDRFSVINSVC